MATAGWTIGPAAGGRQRPTTNGQDRQFGSRQTDGDGQPDRAGPTVRQPTDGGGRTERTRRLENWLRDKRQPRACRDTADGGRAGKTVWKPYKAGLREMVEMSTRFLERHGRTERADCSNNRRTVVAEPTADKVGQTDDDYGRAESVRHSWLADTEGQPRMEMARDDRWKKKKTNHTHTEKENRKKRRGVKRSREEYDEKTQNANPREKQDYR